MGHPQKNRVPRARKPAFELRALDGSSVIRPLHSLPIDEQQLVMAAANNDVEGSIGFDENGNYVLTYRSDIFKGNFDPTAINKSQSKRASKPRNLVGRDRKPLKELVDDFCRKPEYRELPPRDLWPHFQTHLREQDCNPRFRNAALKYELYSGQTKILTFENFRKLVGNSRSRVRP